MGNVERVVRDVTALAGEFRRAHKRFCGCAVWAVCAVWATARPAKQKAAVKVMKATDALVAAAQELIKAIAAAAPDAYRREPFVSNMWSPWDQPAHFGPPNR
ncbi:hypothetical protein PX52LOC_06067 [Limnoglobus roseus]|uniref:Uncharacterized protein n=2 Tax=Limnoglobus roseus TaxID=2598579 RepID=A0A5C1AK12_9BACT|nr:hypothetical protein PX52LOC_06067 [Limnoglobus roseus]